MSGRDPYEQHRVATPLELLYDLTFAVAFAVAGEQFAHLLAEGHFGAQIEALLGTPVYLDLRVKVVKEWQRDSKQLNRLGF
jgi:low temperature requirement protein LtrA